MANHALDRLRDQILGLSAAERAELAHELVKSLDGEPDPDVAEAWEAEILSRLDAIESGDAVLLERAEFARRLRERIKKV